MNILILTAILVCPIPVVIGIDFNNKIDMLMFKRASNRCEQLYPNSPCLVRFEKISDVNDFIAICGVKK